MMEVSKSINAKKKLIADNLRKSFLLATRDDDFNKLCNKLKCNESLLMKYTSKLETTVEQLKKCAKCKGLETCSSTMLGRVLYPEVIDEHIEFSYKSCRHFKKNVKKNYTSFFDTPPTLRNASLSELISEKERKNILEYIKDFLKKKVTSEPVKGLYLSGSFGSGKSYILSALINELSLKGYKTVNVYYPSLLQKIKSSMDDGSYNDILDELCLCDVLLLDDIGAENNTPWARDEILNTIVQYRMDHDLTTFFTSNYTIEELEAHLSKTSKDNDIVKAKRIIERIKYLCNEDTLISKNKRNQ